MNAQSTRRLLLALGATAALLVSATASAQGILLPTNPSLSPLAIKSQRVTAEVKDGTAVTRVEQVFLNEGPSQLEAHYIFPLPKGAALSEFYLWINGKKTKGEILEKEKATGIYEGIVRRLADPGLLEYVDSDVFRVRVFPVPAHGEQKVELTFSQVLDFSGGVYRYHYPLGAAGRGSPLKAVKQDFTFSATLSSRTPIRSIYSPTHQLDVGRRGEAGAVVGLEQGPGTELTHDLDLYYSVSEKAVGLSLLTYREEGEPGYFLALISPKVEFQQGELLGKRVTFVIDTSGSMNGERMKIAKDALRYCVARLNPLDRFNIVRFSTDVEALFPAPREASPELVKKAEAFVDGLEALGGTAIDDAMKRALADNDGSRSMPHIVLFITDGQPTIGETDENAIAANARTLNKAQSRVFTFGVGEDLNARLLDRMAAEGSGTSDYAKDGKELEMKISGFYDKVSHPVLADLSIDLSSIAAYDLYPKKLPDLFKGGQVVVMGRYRNPGDAAVHLTGTVNGVARRFDYGTTVPKERKTEGFIPRLWAIRKVGYLLEEIRLHGEKPELKDEVVALGKKFGIVTPYTSYLVVEDEPRPVVRRTDEPLPPSQPQPWRPHWNDTGGLSSSKGSAGASAPRETYAPSKSRAADKGDEGEFDRAFSAPAAQSLGSSEGRGAIAVSKKMKEMKEESHGPGAGEPVRVAAGRTFLWRDGGWIDSEALQGQGKQLKVKYLSAAYFALLKARPELKAALALGDHVVLIAGKGKTVIIAPGEGEESADKVEAFLK